MPDPFHLTDLLPLVYIDRKNTEGKMKHYDVTVAKSDMGWNVFILVILSICIVYLIIGQGGTP